jgi:hypothetical protein
MSTTSANPSQTAKDSTSTSDRRRWQRDDTLVPPCVLIMVCGETGRGIAGRIADESPGGLGVYVAERVGFFVGQSVEIFCDGELRKAVVRRITKSEDGQVLIGFAWPNEA